MKKLSLLIIVFLSFSSFLCKAQTLYQPGYALLNDGTRISGFILLNENSPWYNQRYIWLKDSVEYIKNPEVKAKKFKADDLKLFQVGQRIFDKVHYVNTENLQLKSLGTNDHMLERLTTGRINAHRFYQYPGDFDIYYGKDKEEVAEKEKKDDNARLRGYKILTQKDNDSKLQDAFDYDLQKYFEDTPEVLQKYQSGGYGNEPIVAKKGLAAKMMAMAKKATFKPQEADAIILAFNDYNLKNAEKK